MDPERLATELDAVTAETCERLRVRLRRALEPPVTQATRGLDVLEAFIDELTDAGSVDEPQLRDLRAALADVREGTESVLHGAEEAVDLRAFERLRALAVDLRLEML
jgi:hypothetical protein